MGLAPDRRTIRWKLHLTAPPEQVYRMLATDQGRARFWAITAAEREGTIDFRFRNGQQLASRILERAPPIRFVVSYFGGSRVEFDLAADGRGGTDLTFTESAVPEAEWLDNLPGWVSVLLNLKAVVEHGVDLRNSDPTRQWEQGYVDV